MSDEIHRIIKDDYLLPFGHSKVKVEIEVESRMNYDKIYFSHSEIELNYCYEVFKYWFNKKDKFKVSDCARSTKISQYIVKKIYNNYIKEK